jgi:integrase
MASIAKREDGKYRARYRDPAGKQHARHFTRKVDATAWLDKIRGELVKGDYIDPAAGKVTFKDFAEKWRKAQVHRPATAAQVESYLRNHAYPVLGDRPIASIRRSEIQAWAKGRGGVLAPTSLAVLFGWVATVFKSAVDDDVIRRTPCVGVKLVKAQRVEVVPLETAEVELLAACVPPRWYAAVMVAAGTGMRGGEVWGLTLDRIDFLRRSVRVDQQLVSMPGAPPSLGPVKTAASVRSIPLPQVVVDVLAAHLAEYPPALTVSCSHSTTAPRSLGTGSRRCGVPRSPTQDSRTASDFMRCATTTRVCLSVTERAWWSCRNDSGTPTRARR